MKNRWRTIFVVTIASLLFVITSDAARRAAKGSSYDGTWSVAIYTLRGDCGSLRAALRIAGGRVYSGDGSYQAYGGVGAGGAIRVTLISGSQSASGSGRLSSNSGAGLDGVPPGVSASARGQRREVRPIIDHLRSGGNGSNAARPARTKHGRAGASELSTRSHLLRVEEAGCVAPPLLTFRLAFSPWNVHT